MRTFESIRCDQLMTPNRLDIHLNKWQQKTNKDLQLEMAQAEKENKRKQKKKKKKQRSTKNRETN